MEGGLVSVYDGLCEVWIKDTGENVGLVHVRFETPTPDAKLFVNTRGHLDVDGPTAAKLWRRGVVILRLANGHFAECAIMTDGAVFELLGAPTPDRPTALRVEGEH